MLLKCDEKKILETGLTFYFSCKLCEKLGWNTKCKNKDECGQRIYKLLKWHYGREDDEEYRKREDLHIGINQQERRL